MTTKTTARPTTPQGIRGMLVKAGFLSSSSSSTKVRGFRNHSEGMSVYGPAEHYDDYICRIEYTQRRHGEGAHERAVAQFAKIQETLKAAGYTFDFGDFMFPLPGQTEGHNIWVRREG